METLVELIARVKAFSQERDWEQFHNVKDLAAALSIETGELQELFLWKNESEIAEMLADPTNRKRVASEIADIGIYLLLLCEKVNIELVGSIADKMVINESRYPIAKSRGNSKKHDLL